MTWVAMAFPVLLVLAIVILKVHYRQPVVWLIAPFVSAIGIEAYATFGLGLSVPLQRHVTFWASAALAQLTARGCSLAAFNTQYGASEAMARNLSLTGTICAFAGMAAMWAFVIIRARRLSQGRAILTPSS